MAKTAKLKKNTKSKSVHSRAAKRATSPSIDLDKSLKDITPPNTHPSVLSVHHGAGITKKKGRGKPLSRQQRIRHEKGLERAETVMDKTEKKVERSIVKNKVAKERNAAWDELSGKVQKKRPKPEPGVDHDDGWEDEKMEEDAVDSFATAMLDLQPSGVVEAKAELSGLEDEVL